MSSLPCFCRNKAKLKVFAHSVQSCELFCAKSEKLGSHKLVMSLPIMFGRDQWYSQKSLCAWQHVDGWTFKNHTHTCMFVGAARLNRISFSHCHCSPPPCIFNLLIWRKNLFRAQHNHETKSRKVSEDGSEQKSIQLAADTKGHLELQEFCHLDNNFFCAARVMWWEKVILGCGHYYYLRWI